MGDSDICSVLISRLVDSWQSEFVVCGSVEWWFLSYFVITCSDQMVAALEALSALSEPHLVNWQRLNLRFFSELIRHLAHLLSVSN